MALSIAARNASGQAITDLLNGGTIKIYTGVAAGVNNAATGTLLGTLTLSNPAFGAWSNGSATANAITGDTSADATGTAGYWRALDSLGNTVIEGDMTELTLTTNSITAGGTIDITSWTMTVPE